MSALTLRLTGDLEARVKLVADVDGLSVSDVLRNAAASYCADRFKDPTFCDEARQRLDQLSQLLDGTPGSSSRGTT